MWYVIETALPETNILSGNPISILDGLMCGSGAANQLTRTGLIGIEF